MKFFSAKRLAICGLIAALYVALSMPLGSLAVSSVINIRPSEALTILPIFFPEAIPALFVGCALSGILCGAVPADIILGSLVTLVAAILTRALKRHPLLSAIFPVLLNALFLPLIWVFFYGSTGYLLMFFSALVSQTLWVYGLGIPLYFIIKRHVFKDN